MNFEKFTLKAQEALNNAVNLTREYNHQSILPEHLILSLIDDPRGIGREVFIKVALDILELSGKIKEFLSSTPKVYGDSQNVMASQRLNSILNYSKKYMQDFGDEYISSEHLVLSLAKERNSLLLNYLNKRGVSIEDLIRIIKQIRGAQKADSQAAEESYQALDKYGKDLTDLAKKGKLDPVIGRDEEIRR
ncbi:MAG: type VI secretion system ATPase TssH, partial [Candidatus Omnitrophica bacterium]|nr:type VI secretion system ATPase TssH [Candidatus Omnitrophota bacterium]